MCCFALFFIGGGSEKMGSAKVSMPAAGVHGDLVSMPSTSHFVIEPSSVLLGGELGSP